MDIWECALGFMDSQILLTSEELGVFDLLDREPCTAAQVAAEADLPSDSAERLLAALCALKLVKKQPDGRYINGPEASEQLVRGKPGYIGEMFHHVREELYPLWHYFKETLIEGKSQWNRAFKDRAAPAGKMYSDSEALRAFMNGMHVITYEAAAEFASLAPELNEIESIVDIGGASGAFLIALARHFPNLKGTVLDLPQVKPIAEDFFRMYGMENRLSFHEADFFKDPMPSGMDAYSLGFILHDWDREAGSHLLKNIADAVRPGGMLIISEYLLNEDKTGPLYIVRADLNMMVAAQGKERTAREYTDWIREFGFELQRIQPTSKGKNFLMARKTKR